MTNTRAMVVALGVFLVLFAGINVAQLWPREGERVLVVFDDEMTSADVLNSLVAADALIIERLSDHRFVLEDAQRQSGNFLKRLNRAGAWLTLNGAAGYGCSADGQRAVFSRERAAKRLEQ